MSRHLASTIAGVLTWVVLCGTTAARTLEFKTTQATDADVAVSADGQFIVFTIVGNIYRVSVKGGAAEQLTFGTGYDCEPTFAPDGRRLAFVSDRDGSGGNVFLLDLETRKVTQVTHETQAGHPTWTPDGKSLFYLRYLPREDDPRTPSIFGGGVPLGELRKIKLESNAKPVVIRRAGLLRSVFFLAGMPAWTVVEQSSAPGSFFPRSRTHIETFTPIEGKARRFRTLPMDLGRVAGSPKGDGIYWRSPQVSFLALPKGTARAGGGSMFGGSPATRFAVRADGKVAYLSERGQLVAVSLDTGKRDIIAFSAHVKREVATPARPHWTPTAPGAAVVARGMQSPALSADGRNLTFMAAGFLWQQELEGKAPARRLIKGNAWERDPALSPSGRQIAYVLSHQGKRDVRVLDLDGGKSRRLFDLGDGSWARLLSWSSDGKRLVFQKSDALMSPAALIAVNVSDGEWTTLTSAEGNWSSRPHFSAKGDALYFTSRMGGPGALQRLALERGARPEPITQLKRHINDGRVSPDGKWLAFRRNSELWVAPLGTELIKEADVRQLSPEGGANFSFTADSQAVVYSVGNRVWKQALAGSKRQELPVRLDWRSPIPPPVLVRKVRVLDFTSGKFSPATSLLIEKGSIRWIGAEAGRKLPEGVTIIDAGGRYAIPGLFDFHVHSTWANHETNPETFLAYGITSVRETGGRLETLCALTDRGTISGDPVPRYFYAGEIFEGAQPMWGDDASLQIATAAEARAHVQRWKARGAHLIKVYPSLPWDLQRATADEARKLGLPVIGHGLNTEETIRSVILGFTSLEHAPITLQEDVRQLLAQAGTRCVPTLSILGGHSNLLRREPDRLDDAKLRAYFPASAIKGARGGGLPGGMGFGIRNRLTNVRDAHKSGIKIHAGTDSLMIGTFFGPSLHWELEHLVEAGLKPLDVLRMATEEAATAVGAETHLGTLAPGKLADLVLLDANPLDNIRHTQAIWRVFKGGWVIDPKTLRPNSTTQSGE